MTREEAIDCINYQNEKFFGGQSEALKMGISALSAEPCEDAIDRKALIDVFRTTEDAEHAMWTLKGIEDEINEMPSVIPIRPKGHWVYMKEGRKNGCFTEVYTLCKCSACGVEQDPYSSQFINFCPICGADMRGSEND